jgi:hypothetical protein
MMVPKCPMAFDLRVLHGLRRLVLPNWRMCDDQHWIVGVLVAAAAAALPALRKVEVGSADAQTTHDDALIGPLHVGEQDVLQVLHEELLSALGCLTQLTRLMLYDPWAWDIHGAWSLTALQPLAALTGLRALALPTVEVDVRYDAGEYAMVDKQGSRTRRCACIVGGCMER